MIRIIPFCLTLIVLSIAITGCASESSPMDIEPVMSGSQTPEETPGEIIGTNAMKISGEENLQGTDEAASKTSNGMLVTSTAFADGENIPTLYTCDGEDISPPIKWENVPDGTQSLALISDDPDAPAGTWVHWIVYNIPPENTGLEAGIPAEVNITGGGKQGQNDFRQTGYGGPCPPAGNPHHYLFKLYALDIMLDPEPEIEKEALEAAMQGHILSEAQLTGKYGR